MMLGALRQRDFALLWSGGLVSNVGDLVLFVALPFFVYSVSGSALATGAMFAAETLLRLLLGSVAGVFVDRWDRRRTMLVADLARAIILLPLLIIQSRDLLWIVYLVAAAESAIGQFFGPAQSALLPRLVGEQHLLAANGLSSLSIALTQLIGPSVGGVLYTLVGLPGVVIADSVSFLVSALTIFLIAARPTLVPAADGAAPGEGLGALMHGWVDGLRLVRRDRVLSTLFLMFGVGMLGQGIINVLVVIFVRAVLHGTAQTFGWLITAQGAGGLLGGLLVAQIGQRLRPASLLLAGGVTTGALLIVMVTLPSVPLALVLIVPIGFTMVGYAVSATTLLQRATDDAYRGRVFGALGTTQALLMLAGIGLASALGDRLGAAPLLGLAGALYFVTGLLALALPRDEPAMQTAAATTSAG